MIYFDEIFGMAWRCHQFLYKTGTGTGGVDVKVFVCKYVCANGMLLVLSVGLVLGLGLPVVVHGNAAEGLVSKVLLDKGLVCVCVCV